MRVNRDRNGQVSLVLGLFLIASLLVQSPAQAAAPKARRLSSVRYGYALTIAPGWTVTRGDCAPFAVIAAGHTPNTLEIHADTGVLAPDALAAAEVTILGAGGTWLGAATHGTLRLHAATYMTTSAVVRTQTGTFAMLVAGVAKNHFTYLVVERVQNPSSRIGKQYAKAEQAMLASLTFAKPAAPGYSACTGTGISRAATPAPTPKVRTTATRTRAASATATHAPVAQVVATSTPAASPPAAPSATDTAAPPPTSTAPPPPAATATPTTAPLPGGIPTSGATDNGCPITPLQASGEAYLLGLLNADRAGAGAPPLTLMPALSVVARDHSCDMGMHDNLSHTGSDGSNPSQRIQTAGIAFSTDGENIGDAGGQRFLPGIASIDQEMMAEPATPGTHHWNIIDPDFKSVGIGIIVIGPSLWITEDFVG